MDAPFNFPPGSRIRKFEVHAKRTAINEYGRVTESDKRQSMGYVYGTLSTVSENEMRRYKGIEHPVSHTLVIQNLMFNKNAKVEVNNTLTGPDGSVYEVQSVTEPSDLPFFDIVFLQKR